MPSNSGTDTPRYVCLDCPEDSALLGFKKRSVAEDHAERTGHEVRDTEA